MEALFHPNIADSLLRASRRRIRSRVNAGLARARARGVRLGRPPVSGRKEQVIRERLATGAGVLKIARVLGVGVSTVQRIKATMQPQAT